MRLSLILFASFCVLSGQVVAATKPNVLFIITDQQHAGMLSCAGNPYLKTPSLDSLAADNNPMQWSGREMREHFADPPADCRPGTYWWWHNGAVIRKEVARELRLMKEAGLRFAHIVTFNGKQSTVVGHDPSKVASPKWVEHVTQCIEDASAIGMKVDLSPCAAWPLNGTWVPDEFAAKLLLRADMPLKGPQQYAGVLPMPAEEDTAYQRDTWGKTRQAFERTFGRSPALTLEAVMLAGPDGKVKMVEPRTVNAENSLTLAIPEGNWRLVAFWRFASGAFGNERRVIDHFSAEAVQKQLNWAVKPVLERVPKEQIGKTFASIYLDNIEGFERQLWTLGMKEIFQKKRGYDLLQYLPLLFDKNGACEMGKLHQAAVSKDETTRRVAADFLQTLAELNRDNCFGTAQRWAQEHGLAFRAEGHQPARGDHIDTNGAADIPEMEVYRARPLAERGMGSLRFAGHLYGHNVLASESYTWQTPHFRCSLKQLREASDELFSMGVNRINNHGWCYSPKTAGWPGWMFYCSTDLNHNNSWFPLYRGLSDYIARVSMVMRAGRPVVDVAYFGGKDPSLKSAGINDATRKYDRVSEHVLENRVEVKARVMQSGFGRYAFLLLRPEAKSVSLDVMRKIETLVNQGANVATLVRPVQVPGFNNFAAQESELKALVTRLFPAEPGLTPKTVGKGQTWWIEPKDFQTVLGQLGVKPQVAAPAAVEFEHRQGTDFDSFFVFNPSTVPIHGAFGFRASGRAELWNARDGTVNALSTSAENGLMRVNLNLPPCTGQLVVFRRGDSDLPASLPLQEVGPVIELIGSWKVEFQHVDGRAAFTRTFERLNDWIVTDGLKYFSGMGSYSQSFILPKLSPTGRYQIDLGEVRDAARVELNGKDLGIVIEPPYRLNVPPNLLKEGENSVTIRVCNLMENAITPLLSKTGSGKRTWSGPFIIQEDLEQLGVLHPSGLLGPVRLTRLGQPADQSRTKAQTP